MGMKIEGDQLVLPPVSERPDGFDLFYQRRSQRKIYEDEMETVRKQDEMETHPECEKEKDQFTLLVSKYQEKTVDPVETDVSGFGKDHTIEVLSETHKGLKRVTRVHSVGIFSFVKYHIWKHEDFAVCCRLCCLHITTHAMAFCFYVSYLNSDLNAKNFVQKLKNFINCV